MTEAGSADRPSRSASEVTGEERRTAAARALLRRHGCRVRETQLARASDDLDLTDAERAALARLADRLVTRLLAGPRRSLRAEDDRERAAATVRDLFE